MTIRTGKGGRYRCYTCSIKAQQGEMGCEGCSIPMKKLDDLVVGRIEDRLLQPERLEEMPARSSIAGESRPTAVASSLRSCVCASRTRRST